MRILNEANAKLESRNGSLFNCTRESEGVTEENLVRKEHGCSCLCCFRTSSSSLIPLSPNRLSQLMKTVMPKAMGFSYIIPLFACGDRVPADFSTFREISLLSTTKPSEPFS